MDYDDGEEPITAEEKALFDKREGKIIGSVFSWEEDLYNPTLSIRNVPGEPLLNSATFKEEIPLASYLESDTTWLEEDRLKVYCIIRCVERRLVGGSTGFQLSKSFIGSSRKFSEKTGQYFVSRGDSTSLVYRYVPSLVAKSPLFEAMRIDYSFYDFLIPESEKVPGSTISIDTKFDFSVLSVDYEDELIEPPSTEPYIIPTHENVNKGDSIIIVGYPRMITDQYLNASYGSNPPPVEAFSQLFDAGKKVVSLGKIKEVSPHFMTISAAACTGMSGSPVFSFSGKLLGFLIGSKPNVKYNIVIRVDHPTFVIEYMTYAGRELLDINFGVYHPNLKNFVAKHYELLKSATQCTLLRHDKRERLAQVLERFN